MSEENKDATIKREDEAKPAADETTRVRILRIVGHRRGILIAILLLSVSAVVLALLLGRRSSTEEGRPVPAPTFETVPSPSGEARTGASPRPGEIVITISPDALQTAQIKTEVATAQSGTAAPNASGIRTTGTVQANAYKEVPVMPVAGGIVRQVNAELGDQVARGQTLVTIFSDELAKAQSEYLKMLAEGEQLSQRHRRTIELVEIGASSREELEQATSAYKSVQAAIASARQQLLLLGMSAKQVDALRSPSQVNSLISVAAPSSGTVISRTVNPGEVIMTGKELFRVADLSTVWVIGQVYENDLAAVRVGTRASITTSAYAGRTFTGRVSYIDPQVNPQTRTAQVRVEVSNPGQVFKIGMFVEVSFGDAAVQAASGQPVVMVPRTSVQNIGSRQVVFVATDQPGTFVQRDVTTGPEVNGLVSVYSGVSAGERVVTEGSFLLRAESLKRNPSQSMNSASTPLAPSQATKPESQRIKEEPNEQQSEPKIQNVRVVLDKDGYKPSSIKLRKDVPAQITFVRQVEATCGTEVVIPEYNIRRELPLNESVVVEFTPNKTGEFKFACGMDMLRGKIIVR